MFGIGAPRAAIKRAVLGFTIFMWCSLTSAQAPAEELLGYWRVDGDAVFIQFVEADNGLEAAVVRADWSPGLVGKKVYEALVYNAEEEVWLGKTTSLDSNETADVELKLRRNKKAFKSKSTSGPRIRMKWKLARESEVN